jgi:hypothetical protein
LEKDCEAVIFFEVLVSNVKNMGLKMQNEIYKAKNLKKTH